MVRMRRKGKYRRKRWFSEKRDLDTSIKKEKRNKKNIERRE